MDLKSLSDEELDRSLHFFVKKEKEVLKEILLHIAEVDRRRLYLKRAYPNLFSYLRKNFGYSEGSAQRRIDAARLSVEVPSVIESLECGEINLSQVVFLQKTFRESAKSKDPKAFHPKEVKAKLLEELKRKSFQESQVIVTKALNVEIKQSPKVLHQANESVRLEVTLSKEQWQKLQEMRRLLSNSLPNGGWDKVLEYLADKVIAQKSKVPGVRAKLGMKALKQTILKRDRCCQYKDAKTGRVCGSKWNLEADHIQPRWTSGANAINNLRVLCANHNKELYRQQANIKRI